MRVGKFTVGAVVTFALASVGLAASGGAADAKQVPPPQGIVYSQVVNVSGYAYNYVDPCPAGYYLSSVLAVSADGNRTGGPVGYSPDPGAFYPYSAVAPFTVYSSCVYYDSVVVLPPAP